MQCYISRSDILSLEVDEEECIIYQEHSSFRRQFNTHTNPTIIYNAN